MVLILFAYYIFNGENRSTACSFYYIFSRYYYFNLTSYVLYKIVYLGSFQGGGTNCHRHTIIICSNKLWLVISLIFILRLPFKYLIYFMT